MTEGISPLAFAVRVLPLYGLALAFTAAGAIPLGGHVPSSWALPVAILTLFVFAGLMTFRRMLVWPTVLLLSFALFAGTLLRLVLPEVQRAWPWAMVACLGIPLVGVPVGWKAGSRLAGAGRGAWAAAWVYILGWIAWQALGHAPAMRPYWGLAGLAVFFALTITWSSSLPGRPARAREIAVASDLYLIGLNLGIAALMITGA